MAKRDEEVVFEIRAHLGVVSKKKDGWKKELNLVSWNGQEPPKFDIRDWSEDHTKMGKGITLFDNEMHKVTQFYNQFCNARVVAESANSRNAAAQAGLKAGAESNEKEEDSQIKDSSLAAESKVPDNEKAEEMPETPLSDAGAEGEAEEEADGMPF